MEKKLTVEDGNRIIAEFSMVERLEDSTFSLVLTSPTQFIKQPKWFRVDELEFHTSWDWLMPVVEKIESSADVDTGNCEVEIIENTCRIYRKPYIREHIKVYDGISKIGAVWQACVQFIQWLNKKQ